MITHSAKETGQQKEQWRWGLQVTGEWGEGVGWTKFEKERAGNIGGSSSRGGAVRTMKMRIKLATLILTWEQVSLAFPKHQFLDHFYSTFLCGISKIITLPVMQMKPPLE